MVSYKEFSIVVAYMTHHRFSYSLGASDRYVHPIFIKRFDPLKINFGLLELIFERSAGPSRVPTGYRGASIPRFWTLKSPHKYQS